MNEKIDLFYKDAAMSKMRGDILNAKD